MESEEQTVFSRLQACGCPAEETTIEMLLLDLVRISECHSTESKIWSTEQKIKSQTRKNAGQHKKFGMHQLHLPPPEPYSRGQKIKKAVHDEYRAYYNKIIGPKAHL